MTARLDGLSRADLETVTGLGFAELAEVANRAGSYYREHTKRIGKKDRDLRTPQGKLRLIHDRLQVGVFRDHPYHDAVYSCKGRGAVRAARRHVDARALLHLDISDFYPSVSPPEVSAALEREGVRRDAIPTLTRLITCDGELPQGAPLSPAVGDLVLLRVDQRLWGLAHKHGFVYTRYVDDLALSGEEMLKKFEGMVRMIVAEEGWELNQKGGYTGPDKRQALLGLVVNTKPNLSREFVSSLRWVLRLAAKGSITLTDDQMESLRGRVYWLRSVNPERGEKLVGLLPPLN